MRNALHEQLLKAGLIDEQRLEQAEREKRKAEHEANRPQGAARPAGKPSGQRFKGAPPRGGDARPHGHGDRRPQAQAPRGQDHRAAQAPAPRAQADAAARVQQRERKAARELQRAEAEAGRRALEREIVQVIKANRHPHNDGDEVFNFVDGRKIGRIYCTAETQRRLTCGELAIVRLRTRYAVVPTATAAGIAAQAPDMVLVAHQAEETSEDPAYAEHPIPDDLRW